MKNIGNLTREEIEERLEILYSEIELSRDEIYWMESECEDLEEALEKLNEEI